VLGNSPSKRIVPGQRLTDLVITGDESMTEKTVKVKVSDRWRVVDPETGEAHTKGDTLSVPEATAEEWVRSGWVEKVK
jgi:hypothetical protein